MEHLTRDKLRQKLRLVAAYGTPRSFEIHEAPSDCRAFGTPRSFEIHEALPDCRAWASCATDSRAATGQPPGPLRVAHIKGVGYPQCGWLPGPLVGVLLHVDC
eukprot:364675-Chlamydomonas_euryale.AAC.7